MVEGINGILVPISDEQPCGDDLSFSPEFDRIQDARREDDPTVDYGEWQAALKQADWPKVIACCTDLLRTRSKDLRLSAWLAEGLVKAWGVAGLWEGIKANAQMIEHFGREMHPRGEEEGGHEQRIATLTWFVMRMSQLVRQIPITQSKSGCYSLNDHESARLLQAQLQRHPGSSMDLEDKVTLEKFAEAVSGTDKALYVQWLAETDRCRLALTALARASDTLFDMDGPSFSPLEEGIDALGQRLEAIAKERGIAAPEKTAVEDGCQKTSAEHADALIAATAAGTIKTRAQALESLREVAAFFRKTEPHSPVAYLADKAAHWGDMPLHIWLRSVVKDNGTRSHIEELLGVSEDSTEGVGND